MAETHESVELVPDATVRYLAQAVLVAALMAVLSQVSIQLPGGVPFSFQPFAVFLAGLLLGPVWGGFTLLVYLVVGLAGAPVFSNGAAGIGYFLGPTGGFLVGFLLAAVVIGAVVHRSATPRPLTEVSAVTVVVALLVALVPIYGVGLPWLASVNGWPLARAASYMALFALGDLLKVAIMAGVVVGGDELFAQLS